METALVRGGYLDSGELDVPMNYRKFFGDLQARRVSDGNLKFHLALAVGSDPQLGAHGSVHGRILTRGHRVVVIRTCTECHACPRRTNAGKVATSIWGALGDAGRRAGGVATSDGGVPSHAGKPQTCAVAAPIGGPRLHSPFTTLDGERYPIPK